MSMRTVRLVDLVKRGRAVSATMPVAPQFYASVAKSLSEPTPQSRSGAAPPIAKDLEVLAVELLALSKACNADPGVLMREALRSIESCLLSIRQQH